jgi:uncharacterized protein (TIGR02246 family)
MIEARSSVSSALAERRARRRRAGLALAAVLAASCAGLGPGGTARTVREVRAATETYAARIAAMESGAIAASFTADGEMAVEGQPPVRGPEAIKKHLEGFSAYHVQSEMLTADAVQVDGATARVSGRFRQTVRVPDGKVVEARGSYRALWVRGADGAWRIRRMTTTPDA